MANRQVVAPAEAEALIATYRAVQQMLEAQAVRDLGSGHVPTLRYRNTGQLVAKNRLNDVADQTDTLAPQAIKAAFNDGIKAAVGGAPDAPMTDSAIALTNQLSGRLEDARRFIGRRVDDVYAKAGRQAALQALLGFHGRPQQTQQALVNLLQDQGLKAFTDRSGRQWRLDTYAEMAIRTITAEATMEGFLQTMAERGNDLFIIHEHPDACHICRPWHDQVVSISGQTRLPNVDVRPMAETPGGMGPPFHPNCRCMAVPYIPEPNP